MLCKVVDASYKKIASGIENLVADRTRWPLFYLQAEDLGISAATLGANIEEVFETRNSVIPLTKRTSLWLSVIHTTSRATKSCPSS